MHPIFSWFVRIILLFVLTLGLVIIYFALKDAINNLKGRNQ